jgi:hypothetical protein
VSSQLFRNEKRRPVAQVYVGIDVRPYLKNYQSKKIKIKTQKFGIHPVKCY